MAEEFIDSIVLKVQNTSSYVRPLYTISTENSQKNLKHDQWSFKNLAEPEPAKEESLITIHI